MINGLTIDEVTAIEDFVNTMGNLQTIPFPLTRTITWNEGENWITITVDYDKLNNRLEIWKLNEEQSNC